LLANNVYGTATIVSVAPTYGGLPDAESYNAVGIKAKSGVCANPMVAPQFPVFCDTDADCTMPATCQPIPQEFQVVDGEVLRLGSSFLEPYNGCPETLIVDHIFDGAPDPVAVGFFVTDLTLVPCSEDFRTGTANLGRSSAQFLVFNEFEQRFSTTEPVTCF